MSDHVVLGPPYEGGLWYLLSRENPSTPPGIKGHPYYERLYGSDPMSKKIRAVNLASLFDEILLPPADEFLPDHWEHGSDNMYFNPEMRLRVNLDWTAMSEFTDLADRLLKDENIITTLAKHSVFPSPDGGARMFIRRSLAQIRLALDHDAVLVAGDGFSEFVDDLMSFVGRDVIDTGHNASSLRTLSFSSETIRLVGLDWACDNVDSFCAIRTSDEISDYASEFRKILRTADSSKIYDELLAAMRKAMEWESVARKAHKGFETTGVVSTAIGAIPAVGTPAALVGLKSFLAAKQTERSIKRNRWYLIGSKIREVGLKHLLQTSN